MNFYSKYLYLFCLFLSGIFGGLYLSQSSWLNAYIAPPTQKLTPLEEVVLSPKVQEAYRILSDHYYKFNEHEKTKLVNGVIAGVVGSLEDKHSEFFTLDEAKAFHETLAGDFEGIGAVVGDDKRGVIIEKIIPDSPAEKSGIEAGNIITEVAGESIAGLLVKDAVKKIRGPKGTTVKLKLFNPVTSAFQTVTVTRSSITIPSVSSKMLTGSIGYIEVSIFGEKTNSELRKSLDALTLEGARGFIIDLRYNGGGYLDEAASMLSSFIERNQPLVVTKGSVATDNYTLFSEGGKYLDTPLVFLVNDLSASASEIMVGAMQDYERAIVVGEKTYGKGSVQQPFILSDGSELKITVAKWYTPKDRGIDGTGIKPDVEVLFKDEDYKNKYDRQLEVAKQVIEEFLISKDRSATIQKFSSQELNYVPQKQ